MNLIYEIFGKGDQISAWQMGSRAVIIFILAVGLIRVSGRRSFGMKSPFDNTITILLGAVLSRAVVGASPFLSTLGASVALVLMHRFTAWCCRRFPAFEQLIKGKETVLYQNGKIIDRNMDRALVSESDLMAAVRNLGHETKLENIEKAFLETNGRMSIILKEAQQIKKPGTTEAETEE